MIKLSCLLMAIALTGCGMYEIPTGREERRGGQPTTTTRTIGKPAVPVEVFLDGRSLGVWDTDAQGQVRVNLRDHLGPGPRGRAHRIEFLIHDPNVNPPRVELIAPPGG